MALQWMDGREIVTRDELVECRMSGAVDAKSSLLDRRRLLLFVDTEHQDECGKTEQGGVRRNEITRILLSEEDWRLAVQQAGGWESATATVGWER
ncbi:hypothetical protein RISK_002402 [Rhodopirellula islandica]|uniref:Uncharacterized protein n=1 Tax=Rhodopirellula islandica TaxID=595434 RepID=A0A0J1BGU9_RHOIS|nr:hypothetical protein [Rhodopirellula islandica]KLU05770.1 hypothetical protein RISK_002402 [Rhodopirellula islandica]